jgi:hypothetical protein
MSHVSCFTRSYLAALEQLDALPNASGQINNTADMQTAVGLELELKLELELELELEQHQQTMLINPARCTWTGQHHNVKMPKHS